MLFLCTLSPLCSVLSPVCCLTLAHFSLLVCNSPARSWRSHLLLALPSFMQCPQLGRSLLLDPCPSNDIDVLVCRGCHGIRPHFPSRKLQCSGTLQKIASYLLGEKRGTVRSWIWHLSVCGEGELFWRWVAMWKQPSMRIKFPGALYITQAAVCII